MVHTFENIVCKCSPAERGAAHGAEVRSLQQRAPQKLSLVPTGLGIIDIVALLQDMCKTHQHTMSKQCCTNGMLITVHADAQLRWGDRSNAVGTLPWLAPAAE
jgi:hypothetical protein